MHVAAGSSADFSVEQKTDPFFSLHHTLDDLAAGLNPGKFSTMEFTEAIYGVSLESPRACCCLSLSPASANPLHPAIIVGLLSRDPRQGLAFGSPKHARSPVCPHGGLKKNGKGKEEEREESSFVPGSIFLRL